jgi:ubiquinone/menaquinone biosynthesis C-methylase UbiE
MEFTGERVIISKSPISIENEHMQRYLFASRYAKGKSCLDIGCGTGYGSQLLLDAGAIEVVGVDISNESISYAREQYNRSIKFIVSDAESYKEGQYDLVVSFETIEHLENRQRYLSNLYEMLKDDGVLIISTPNKALTSPMREPYNPRNKWHKYEYSKKIFAKTLKCSGFCIEGMYGQYLFPSIYDIEVFTKLVWVMKGWFGLSQIVSSMVPEILPLSNKAAYFLVFVLKKDVKWINKYNSNGEK